MAMFDPRARPLRIGPWANGSPALDFGARWTSPDFFHARTDGVAEVTGHLAPGAARRYRNWHARRLMSMMPVKRPPT